MPMTSLQTLLSSDVSELIFENLTQREALQVWQHLYSSISSFAWKLLETSWDHLKD